MEIISTSSFRSRVLRKFGQLFIGFGEDDTLWADFEGDYSSFFWWVFMMSYFFLCYLQAFFYPCISEGFGVIFFGRSMYGAELRCTYLLLCTAAEQLNYETAPPYKSDVWIAPLRFFVTGFMMFNSEVRLLRKFKRAPFSHSELHFALLTPRYHQQLAQRIIVTLILLDLILE